MEYNKLKSLGIASLIGLSLIGCKNNTSTDVVDDYDPSVEIVIAEYGVLEEDTSALEFYDSEETSNEDEYTNADNLSTTEYAPEKDESDYMTVTKYGIPEKW